MAIVDWFNQHPAWLTAILTVVSNVLVYVSAVWRAGRRLRQLSTSKEFDAVLSGREALERNQLSMISGLQQDLERYRLVIEASHSQVKTLMEQINDLDRRLKLCEESRRKFDEMERAQRLSREASATRTT